MTSQEKLWEALDDVLVALSAQENLVNSAYKAFNIEVEKFLGQIDPTVFNEWFLHHYADIKNMSKELMPVSDIYLEAISRAHFSVYSVWVNKKYVIFEDIFTKRQFHIHQNDFDGTVDKESLYLTRIYDVRGSYAVSMTYEQMPKSAQTILVKEVMLQYQKAKDNGTYTIEGFLRETPLLLNWAMMMIDSLAIVAPEEEFVVYELSCRIDDPKIFKKFCEGPWVKDSILEGVYTYENADIDAVDFVIEGKRVIFECPHEAVAEILKERIENSDWGIIPLGVAVVEMADLISDES